ncbi:hypothetical protein CANARDRAFT_5020 [[Candida] arabinofermentans NRRL YB-2248]|uniref:Uncharacterized protein n=1 Tax=[Candida] arabinofermentans NRRL YB-2248 TaxID=983967 RepID=A0A1E4T7I3_9ASCO|nr:hypothetical protein CANARDRAFT_5020 [[Candida] arabinofermentans NRRL YB-2248]
MIANLSTETKVDKKTQTFIKLMTLFPLELQYKVMSFIEWDECPITSLLKLILDGSSLLQMVFVNILFRHVALFGSFVYLGDGSLIKWNSPDFKLLLKVVKYLKSRNDLGCEHTIETLSHVFSKHKIFDWKFFIKINFIK